MKKKETTISFLEQFLPQGTFEEVAPFFQTHTIYLTLTHERKSVLGDYRNPTKADPYHRISINATLNPYSFLITLLHELAHLLTYIHFGHRVNPHGKEWKTQFRHILIPFLGKRYFPGDVEKALYAYIHNPAASTCTDPQLYKSLYKYDKHEPGRKLVDDIAINSKFQTEDGQLWLKIEKLRTRTRCKNLTNNKMYLFQGIVEVREITE
ncbi:MAG: SprT-like domain-containing protein [Taibaiella sp.]|nr:SprT-like domain-containing protein [Taibaiella sp.]